MSSTKCIYALKSAKALIAEAITMIENPESIEDNCLMAFVEVLIEAQHDLTRGLHSAIRPALTPPDPDDELPSPEQQDLDLS